MTTPIILPPSLPYPGNYQSLAANSACLPPKEGFRTIPMPITWSADGGANRCLFFNGAYQTVAPISQIGGLYVDNTNCGVPIQFIFADTQFELSVPANSGGYFPVITGQVQFSVYAPGSSTGDVTYVQVLNFAPRPGFFQQNTFNNLAGSATGPGMLIPVGNWILDYINIIVYSALCPEQTNNNLLQSDILTLSAGTTTIWRGGFSLFSLQAAPNSTQFLSCKTLLSLSQLNLTIPSLELIVSGTLQFNMFVNFGYRAAPA